MLDDPDFARGELALLSGIGGLLLLLFGRRLYWIFVGLVGFLAAFVLVDRLLAGRSEWLTLLVALLAGAAGALLSVFFQRLAIALAGFLLGGLAVFWWAEASGREPDLWIWAAAALIAVLGGLLARGLFELALVALSALLGSSLLLEAFGRAAESHLLIWLALAAVGIAFQLLGRRRARSARGRRRS